jgi:hypothetical protein
MVFGTSSETYTMPGITSAKSRSRQSGPLEVVTTDADGNLASDGGTIFRDILANTEGIAMAMAMDMPHIPPGKRFAISPAFGFFEGEEAIILAGRAQILPWLSAEAGVGAGFSQSTVGGRVGVTFAW